MRPAHFPLQLVARAVADACRHAPRRLGVVCSSRVCPFRRRARVGRRQHPRCTIAACNHAGLAFREAVGASYALRACARFVVARVLVVVSTLGVRSRRATARGYAFRVAVGTYKEALEQLRLRLRRQRRVAAAVASAAAKQPWAAITPARTRRLGRSLRGRTPHAPPLGRHVFQRF